MSSRIIWAISINDLTWDFQSWLWWWAASVWRMEKERGHREEREEEWSEEISGMGGLARSDLFFLFNKKEKEKFSCPPLPFLGFPAFPSSLFYLSLYFWWTRLRGLRSHLLFFPCLKFWYDISLILSIFILYLLRSTLYSGWWNDILLRLSLAMPYLKHFWCFFFLNNINLSIELHTKLIKGH